MYHRQLILYMERMLVLPSPMPAADGSVILWQMDGLHSPVCKLTGPDIDHMTGIRIRGDKIYTSCRDGSVRIYSTEHISFS